jgi:hypothetical protein
MGVLKNLFGKKEPAEHSLRAMALKATAQDLELAPTAEAPNIFGMIMDQTMPMVGTATVVAFADGAVSMYFGAKGGIIGAGQHENVRTAAEQWLAVGQTTYEQGKQGLGLEDSRYIRIIWKGFDGDRHQTANVNDFLTKGHPLYDLFGAAQNVITQIRLLDQARKG